MKIDEMYEEVTKVGYDCIKLNGPSSQPNIGIYVEYGYYHEARREVTGASSTHGYEFVVSDTIRGFPIFVVLSGVQQRRYTHPPFRVVLLN